MSLLLCCYISLGNLNNLSGLASPLQVKLDFRELELAQSPACLQRGLMYRKYLCPGCGMLFDLGEERVASFWMRNTYIPLDIVFITEAGGIDIIHRDTTPLREDILYSSISPVRYVLEVNAGFATEHLLQGGLQLDIPDLLKQTKPCLY